MTLKITKYPFKWVKGLPCAHGSISNFRNISIKKIKTNL